MFYQFHSRNVEKKNTLDDLFLKLVLKKIKIKIQNTTVGMSDFTTGNEVMCKRWVLQKKKEIKSTNLVEE